MKITGRCKFLCTASAIIFLLGAVQGIGGVVDLINNTELLIKIGYGSVIFVLLLLAYIFLSAATFITAISLYEQNKNFIIGGMILSTLFIIISFAEGPLLFNETGGNKAIINSIAALIIISLLSLSKISSYKNDANNSSYSVESEPDIMEGTI